MNKDNDNDCICQKSHLNVEKQSKIQMSLTESRCQMETMPSGDKRKFRYQRKSFHMSGGFFTNKKVQMSLEQSQSPMAQL